MEEAELQKEPKTGQTEEVAFRKIIPHPAQQNLTPPPLMYTPVMKIFHLWKC